MSNNIRKYGPRSMKRNTQAVCDQWSPNKPTFANVDRLMTKAVAEGDTIAWAAGMITLKNMYLLGDM